MNLGQSLSGREDIRDLTNDIIERAVWTFGQTFTGAAVVLGFDAKAIGAAAVGALVSATKSVLLARFGKGTAALIEPSGYRPAPAATPDTPPEFA